MKMRQIQFKIFETIFNYLTLIWLLLVSFLSRPHQLYMDNLPFDVNHQYGQVYMITISITLIASSIIIWRLIKPYKWLRLVTGIIIISTIIISITFVNTDLTLSEYLRRLLYGPLN
jgi:carbon starvation protein CstA